MRYFVVHAKLVAAGFIAAASLTTRASPSNPCAGADALVEQGYLPQAEELYEKLMQPTRSQPCASKGLKRTAVVRCEAGERLLAADRPDEAKKAYDVVLQKSPTMECALAGVGAVAERARRRSCETADALAKGGLDAEARTAYGKVLEAAPKAKCAIDGLQELASPYALRWARRAVDGVGAAATVLIAEVVGLLLVVWLFVRWIRLVHPLKLKLDMDKVSPGGSGLDAGPCEQIMTLIEHELDRLGRRPHFARPTLIDGPLETPSLPDLTSLTKGANALWNALLTLVPARTVSFSAVLLKDASGNCGLLLRLVYLPTKELWGSFVLADAELTGTAPASRTSPDASAGTAASKPAGGSEPADAARYARLARAAAAWACWKIHERTGHTRAYRGKSCIEARCTEMHRAFGTSNWLSYATATLGAAERKRDPAGAKRALRVALARDPENRLALYNLAALEEEQRGAELASNERLYERLGAYFEKARGPVKDKEPFDPVRVFADFHLGGIAFYRQFELDGPKAEALLLAASEHFRRAHAAAAWSPERAGEVLLDSQIAWATCLRMTGHDEEARKLVAFDASRVLPASALYNLACFYSNPKPEAGVSTDEFETASQYLEDALEADPSFRSWAAKDPSLRNLRSYRDDAEEDREGVTKK